MAPAGNKNWGLGPTAVLLHIEKGSPWVYGALVNNVWSLSSDEAGGSYNTGLIQPFVNYNFPEGFYLTSAPIATVDWQAASGQKWTVLLGGGVGKIFHLGKLPVNIPRMRLIGNCACKYSSCFQSNRNRSGSTAPHRLA